MTIPATSRQRLTLLEARIIVAFATVAHELTLGMLERYAAARLPDAVRRTVRCLQTRGLLCRHRPETERPADLEVRACRAPYYTLSCRGASMMGSARRIIGEGRP